MCDRRLSLRAAIAIIMTLPLWAMAQAPAQPTPHRRAADPAVVLTLKAHRWTVQSATDAAGKPIGALTVPGQAMVLLFDGPLFGVEGGCNRMNSNWRINPQGQLLVGRLASTMKACPRPLMHADAAMSELLAQPLQLELQPGATPPSLRLVASANETLVLVGQPTLQSQYGEATRIFLEVAAQTVPCPPPAAAGAECLQARERRFDAKGLPDGQPGPWRPMVERIEGYTHVPGVRTVLRIDRYSPSQGTQAAAGGASGLYVLDMMVESEVVSK